MIPLGWTILLLATICGGIALLLHRLSRKRANGEHCSDRPISGLYNVHLPEPSQERGYVVRCPYCSFQGPLQDLSLIGDSVDCPCCEQPFRSLEPSLTGTASE